MNELKALFQTISEDSAKEIHNYIKDFDIKNIDSDRKFKVIASTEDTDRSWEIIKVNWWNTEDFMKNPVIIANHVYKIENIVGRATNIIKENWKLIIEWIFSKSNPLWVLLADLYDEWMIKTVSVWFIPHKRDQSNPKIITEAELLELSFVAVPCNPNALSLDQKELLKSFWMIKENEETLDSSSSEKNNNDKGVNDFTTNENINKQSENTTKILSTLNDIKSLLEVLVDGNTKKLSEANILAKETLQNVARTVNQWLSEFKKSL